MSALSIALPLIIAGVLICSGIAKLRRPDTIAGWEQLGVPVLLRRRWLVMLHPWGEVALGLAVAVLGGVLGLAAAAICSFLMATYLVLVWRALSSPGGASCSCFGTRRRVTRLMVARNAWLLALTAAATSVIWVNPLWGGALAATDGESWWWIAAVAVAALTATLIVWPDDDATGSTSNTSATPAGSGTDADYVRLRTPAVPVTMADGTTVNLRSLAAARPQLLLAVSSLCDVCRDVVEKAPEWRRRLPELDVRLLLLFDPEVDRYTEHSEPQSLHDPAGYVRGSLADWPTPSAILLGADGLLAGGPVSGFEAIAQFVSDVDDSLHDGGLTDLHSATAAG